MQDLYTICGQITGDVKEDVTNSVKSFYEETPFPNYDDFDDVSSLLMKSRQGIFAKLLDEQIPFENPVEAETLQWQT